MENSVGEKSKQDVMVSNLPLLFSEGKPTSINSMSVEDLQYFIPFLIKCIIGCEPSGWAKYVKFKWWPPDVPWSSIILTKKHQTQNWRNKLQKVVKNCYEYNGCTYLLHFSAKLQTLTGGYRFDDNWDGTTSMFDSTSGKLLVTFQNENMNYDKGFRQQSNTNRPMLLPRLNSPNSPTKMGASTSIAVIQAPSAAKMVEPPVNDIYLCDFCGADFSSLSAIKAHETKCIADKAMESRSTNTFPDLEVENMDEAKFMWYLSLSARNQKNPPANVTPAKVRPVVRRTCTLSDKRFTTIPFSSNLGQSFFKAALLTSSASENLISRYERLCVAKPLSRPSSMTGDYTGSANPSAHASHRLRPVLVKRKEEWTHTYSFSRADRKERMRTIRTGLNKRARQLFHQCGSVKLVLERLKPEVIEMWTRPKPQIQRPLLQPWLQRSIANLPPSCTISLAPVDPQNLLRRQQLPSPSLTVSRPVMVKQSTAFNSTSTKAEARSPPGLLPLITSAWSMQTMQTAKAKPVNNQFTLPDLIPVLNRHPKPRSTDPLIIQMASTASTKSPIGSPLSYKPFSRSVTTDIVDLCSSEDEADDKREASSSHTPPKRLVLPPGISITKVNRSPAQKDRSSPPTEKRLAENNNSPSRSIAQWLKSATLPVLRLMGHHSIGVKKDVVQTPTDHSPHLIDSTLPIVTPLKLGKLPPEKREQMKQSLLKIQQKEGKSPSSSAEKSQPTSLREAHLSVIDVSDSEILPSTGSDLGGPSKNPLSLVKDECSDLKRNDESDSLSSNQQRLGRRKRETEIEFYSCDEDDPLSEGPSKKAPRLDASLSMGCREVRSSSDTVKFPAVIEVDVAGPYNGTLDGSRASSFGSLTPDRRQLRKKEVDLLKGDECKELKRKGLGDISFEEDPSRRRPITRCRTKTLPIAVNK